MEVTENLHAFIWQSMTQNNCNTYLINGPTKILIDPGHLNLFAHVRDGLEELELDIDDIGLVITTHAHPDHVESLQLFKDSPAQITLHEVDWQFVKKMMRQLGPGMQVNLEAFQPQFFLNEGDLAVNGMDFKIFHTPGHSPGSISIYWTEKKALFTGDLIFKDGVGRTDLPGGNGKELKESIKRLEELDVEYLLSGHGDVIFGKQEVERNFEIIERQWFGHL